MDIQEQKEVELKRHDWRTALAEKMNSVKMERHRQTYEQIKKEVDGKLRYLISLYFNNWSLEEADNKANFDLLNKEWKSQCYKITRTKGKYIKIDPKAFETNVRMREGSEEFKKTVADIKADIEKSAADQQEVIVSEGLVQAEVEKFAVEDGFGPWPGDVLCKKEDDQKTE